MIARVKEKHRNGMAARCFFMSVLFGYHQRSRLRHRVFSAL
ncbi:hypothetical protein YPPY66_4470 [Yersinia pestis PY-66]|uniref:Uncharacterized protein n=1 Tax=Yersinia pestis PY-08 TaxID=992134 RepID=A0AB72ZE91_YERPE|nr:hypothetical protein YpF1991016_2381 [Yersinia pestis biovar Orientalis str. F1991016]EDR57565.1 hypothetical protein YpMG051020_4071 [Yersinia pestis biovar Orientalis str. MG05-1020]EDR59976.1 hypothetical protein YpUG050454_3209 [Yersinia pestis biovar Antiqua str. UG05-0454]EDR65382.1 hypothetical protein YpK1973002_3091 [Yersinia pestis biovar Mediaevalis str. K1973002]EFA47915.1 hypothetical protein YPD27_2160 [Yersinia pestis KIM D27]EIQ84725.1 hypothetical protein YPPY03_4205 [Yersi